METSDQQYTNEEQLIEDKFQELLNGYLNSNHRKKVEIIERAFKFAKEAHKGNTPTIGRTLHTAPYRRGSYRQSGK